MAETDPRQQLMQLTSGFSKAQAVFAAAELGLADLIAGGTVTLDDLARATATERSALRRFMRYMVGLGIFDRSDSAFALTAMGEYLRSDVTGSRRAAARMTGRFWPAYSEILHSLRTGQSGFHKAYGTGLFDFLAADPEASALFDTLMEAEHGRETPPIVAAYDFSQFRNLMDVGGGNGSLLLAILRSCPDLQGTVFDRPDVASRAEAGIAASEVAGRCRVVGGDFFESVPPGAEAILLRHVLHDWYDDDAAKILSNCRRALPEDGRILVLEAIVADDNLPSAAKQADLAMLVVAGGTERTEAEYRALFDRAGFTLTQVVGTECPVSVIEGRPKPLV